MAALCERMLHRGSGGERWWGIASSHVTQQQDHGNLTGLGPAVAVSSDAGLRCEFRSDRGSMIDLPHSMDVVNPLLLVLYRVFICTDVFVYHCVQTTSKGSLFLALVCTDLSDIQIQ